MLVDLPTAEVKHEGEPMRKKLYRFAFTLAGGAVLFAGVASDAEAQRNRGNERGQQGTRQQTEESKAGTQRQAPVRSEQPVQSPTRSPQVRAPQSQTPRTTNPPVRQQQQQQEQVRQNQIRQQEQVRQNQIRQQEEQARQNQIRQQEQVRQNQVRQQQERVRQNEPVRKDRNNGQVRQGGNAGQVRQGNIGRAPTQINRQQQQQIRQQRAQLYNNRWQNWQNIQAQRQRQLEQQRRRAYLEYQRRYWERIRLDQIRLQQIRYYDNLFYNYRYVRGGQIYYTSQYGARMLQDAINYGYEEGFRAGQADRMDGWGFNPTASYGYMDASFGYDSYYVDLTEYNYYFREGFRRGYEDGYYGRYQYGTFSNGKYQVMGSILGAILDLIRF